MVGVDVLTRVARCVSLCLVLQSVVRVDVLTRVARRVSLCLVSKKQNCSCECVKQKELYQQLC